MHVLTHFGAYHGDMLKLMDDIGELKPTIFMSVRQLFNRIYNKINVGVAEKGELAGALFANPVGSKKEGLKRKCLGSLVVG